MGITLIVVSQQVVTDRVSRLSLVDWTGVEAVPGNSPCVRPYPKPTQVDR
jgi:hypothetical protein